MLFTLSLSTFFKSSISWLPCNINKVYLNFPIPLKSKPDYYWQVRFISYFRVYQNCVSSGILDTECLPEPTIVAEGVECWEWWVENKYYTATVQLANVLQPEQCLPWIMEHGEACLIYCDATQVSGVQLVLGVNIRCTSQPIICKPWL